MLPRKPLLAALALTLFGGTAQAADEVVVYSSRIDELIKPVFDAYTAETGVKVKFITDKEAPLMQRIKAEMMPMFNPLTARSGAMLTDGVS